MSITAAGVMPANASMDDLDGGCSLANWEGGTGAYVELQRGLYGPLCAPPELVDFLGAQSVRDAAQALGLGRGTVHRLASGYWPSDPRKLMQAWSAYKGRAGALASSWFLRRVRLGGTVRHAGLDYTAPRLAARTGQLLAVARTTDGSLLAQTLELPSERLSLELLR